MHCTLIAHHRGWGREKANQELGKWRVQGAPRGTREVQLGGVGTLGSQGIAWRTDSAATPPPPPPPSLLLATTRLLLFSCSTVLLYHNNNDNKLSVIIIIILLLLLLLILSLASED